MRSILRLKRVCAEKHGFIRRYKASFAKSGIASLPDLCFDVLRIWGNVRAAALKPAWGFAPNPTEGLPPSDSLLRFAAVLIFLFFEKPTGRYNSVGYGFV